VKRLPERLADPYRDLDVIDSRAPRFNQAVVGSLSALAVATGWWWLLALLAAFELDRIRAGGSTASTPPKYWRT